MTPEYAKKILPPGTVVYDRCIPNAYGGAWVVFARLPNGTERPLTQFVDPVSARWINSFNALDTRAPTE